MKFIDKLERKFGRFGVPNLMFTSSDVMYWGIFWLCLLREF